LSILPGRKIPKSAKKYMKTYILLLFVSQWHRDSLQDLLVKTLQYFERQFPDSIQKDSEETHKMMLF